MKQKEFNKIFVETITSKSKLPTELLSQIKDGPKLSAIEAIAIYREDYNARLTEALRNTYRAIHFILGDEDFNRLSKAYIAQYPSLSSDLDDYGDNLSLFTFHHDLIQDYIFLAELAHFEWNYRELFHLEPTMGLTAQELIKLLHNENERVQLSNKGRILQYQYKISELYALKKEGESYP